MVQERDAVTEDVLPFDIHIRKSAGQVARLACREFQQQEHLLLAIHSGVMLELMLKAYLAKLSPSFVVTPDFPAIRALAGIDDKPSLVHTINFRTALDRVIQLTSRSEFPIRRVAECDGLIEARNSAAHAGASLNASEQFLLAAMACNALLALVDWPQEDFWGEQHGYITSVLRSRDDAVELEVTSRLRAAQDKIGAFTLLADDQQQVIREFVAKSVDELVVDEECQRKECPSCHSPDGTLFGEIETSIAYEGDPTTGEYSLDTRAAILFTPEEFECRLCGLKLRDAEQLKCVGLPCISLPLREATEDEVQAQQDYEMEMAFEAFVNSDR